MTLGLTPYRHNANHLLLIIAASFASAQHPPWAGGGGDGDHGGFGGPNGLGSGQDGTATGGIFGPATAVLTGALPTGTSSGGPSLDSENVYGYVPNQVERYRSIHGVLAAMAFIIFFPMGGIIVRLIPGRLAMALHALTQIVGFGIFFAASALGFWILANFKPRGLSLLSYSNISYHAIIGLLIFLILLSMPVLGILHHIKYKQTGGRTTTSYVHIWLGRTLITVGIINGGLGLHVAEASHDMKVAYAIVAAIVWVLWMFASVLGEVRRRQEQRDSDSVTMTNARVRETPVQRYMRERAEREREEEMQIREAARGVSSVSDSEESPPYTDVPMFASRDLMTGPTAVQRAKLRDDVSDLSSRT